MTRALHCLSRRRVLRDIRSIRSRDFTVISSNCLGSVIYQTLGMPYLTPTVGLFFYAPCFIKFIADLPHYISTRLESCHHSKYPRAWSGSESRQYPIGSLEGVELHFLHYRSFSEAREKWERRCERVLWDRLCFVFTDRDLCTVAEIRNFVSLPSRRKVCFTSRHMPELRCLCTVPGSRGKPHVDELTLNIHLLDGVFCFREFIDGP